LPIFQGDFIVVNPNWHHYLIYRISKPDQSILEFNESGPILFLQETKDTNHISVFSLQRNSELGKLCLCEDKFSVDGSSNIDREEGFVYEVTTQQGLAHVAHSHAEIEKSDRRNLVFDPTLYTCEVDQAHHIHFHATNPWQCVEFKWRLADAAEEEQVPQGTHTKKLEFMSGWDDENKQRMSREWVAHELKFEGGEQGAPLQISFKVSKHSDPESAKTICLNVPGGDQGFCGYKVDRMSKLFLHAFKCDKVDTVQFVIVFP
jgi:hypothetical protein